MRVGGVPELLNEGMPLESLLDDPALNPLAAPVNQADLAQPRLVRRVHILLDHRSDVAGGERMEIERPLDGNPVGQSTPNSQRRNSQFPRSHLELGVGSLGFGRYFPIAQRCLAPRM